MPSVVPNFIYFELGLAAVINYIVLRPSLLCASDAINILRRYFV